LHIVHDNFTVCFIFKHLMRTRCIAVILPQLVDIQTIKTFMLLVLVFK